MAHIKVIIVARANKVVDTLDDVMKRVKHIVPMNSKRIKHETPSIETARCMNCLSQKRICNYLTIIYHGMKFEGRSTEFAENIRESSRHVTQVMEIVQNAVEMANQANSTILELQTQSQEIGKILKIIDHITQQTNLLALNATIEAARAGESGRGFGIVAHEVKELAHQTSESARDITEKIATMQVSSQNAADAITHVVQIIHQISEFSRSIDMAMSELTGKTNDIVNMIVTSAKDSEEITQAIAEVAAAAQESSAQVDYLKAEASYTSSLTDRLKQLAEKLQS